MSIITIGNIRTEQSDQLKREVCDKYMEHLREKLSDEELERFKKAFYSVSDGYLFGNRGQE